MNLYSAAVRIGKLNGRNVYRVPVQIRHNNTRRCRTDVTRDFTVIAYGAADAADWAREHEGFNVPNTEIEARGPKGGRVVRFISWDRAVSTEIFGLARRHAAIQTAFEF